MITLKVFLPQLKTDVFEAKIQQLTELIQKSKDKTVKEELSKRQGRFSSKLEMARKELSRMQSVHRDIPITSSPCRLVNGTARCETPLKTNCIEVISFAVPVDFIITDNWNIETVSCIFIPEDKQNTKNDLVAFLDKQDRLNLDIQPYLAPS